jgi:TRAP-type transport system small permease protein
MNNTNSIQYIIKFFKRLSTYLAYIGAFTLFIMMCLTITDVVGRCLFNRPINGTIELTKFMVLVIIFAFLAHTQAHKVHINVDLFVRFIPDKLKNYIEIVNHIACLAIMILITWMGFEKALEILEAGETSPNLTLPNHPFVFFLVLGCAIMCIEFIRDIIFFIRKKEESK